MERVVTIPIYETKEIEPYPSCKGRWYKECEEPKLKKMVKKMHDDLKTTYDVLNEMFEDYEDARLGVAYRFLGEVLEDLELLIDEEE